MDEVYNIDSQVKYQSQLRLGNLNTIGYIIGNGKYPLPDILISMHSLNSNIFVLVILT